MKALKIPRVVARETALIILLTSLRLLECRAALSRSRLLLRLSR